MSDGQQQRSFGPTEKWRPRENKDASFHGSVGGTTAAGAIGCKIPAESCPGSEECVVDPSISVIIPAFNAVRYLPDAIESVRAQTLRPREIIVIDDGSTDATSEVLAGYGSVLITERQENQGAAAARNRGLDLATGRFVAFLDADDVSAPQRLERQLVQLQGSHGAAACFTGYWRFDGVGGRVEHPAPRVELPRDPVEYLANCVVLGASAMVDRLVARNVRYPTGTSATEDLIFTALLATTGPLTAIPEALYGYRAHERQTSLQHHPRVGSYPHFEQRLEWARANAATVWPDRSWDDIERALWQGLAKQTEAAYWVRNRRFFLQDREYIRRHWPSHLRRPGVAEWKWYPDWAWNAKGVVDRWLAHTGRP